MFEICTIPCDDEGHETETTESEKENARWCKAHRLATRGIDAKKTIDFCLNFAAKKSPSGIYKEMFNVWNPAYTLFPLRALGFDQTPEFTALADRCTSYLERRRIKSHGGFSGFPQDSFHAVSNYAAIMGLALIGTERAYNLIDRSACYRELLSLKQPDGSFMACPGQEADIRSTFTAIMIADTLNILTPELTRGVVDFARRCQRFDGGIGPSPGLESHGGYVHCGVGVLYILGELDALDLPALIRWIMMRQMDWSGGFNGRPHKLVDSCYSWWIGTACRIIADHLQIPPFWNEKAMADYILELSQSSTGGFCDHPPDRADPFHTMYALGGLCICGGRDSGGSDVKLPEADVVMCCTRELADKMRAYFREKPFVAP